MKRLSELPQAESDIDAAWLQAALNDVLGGVRIETIQRVQRIDGTATKLRFRIGYANAVSTGAPQHVWVKGHFDAKGVDQGDAFLNEAHFYRDLAPQLQLRLRLPRCYHASIDAGGNLGVIVLEDLLDRGASFGATSRPLTAAIVSAVLDQQARYHAAFWRDPGLSRHEWLKAGGAIAGSDMIDQYFAAFWDASSRLPRFRFVTRRLHDRERMRSALVRMIEHDVRHAECLVHGDSHCANLFFDAEGQPGYLDWQHVMRGSWAFDVASLIVTGMTVEERRADERELLENYRSRLLLYGATPPSLEKMFDEYRRHAVWSFMWVMCPVSAHPEEICTLNAERACMAIEDLGSIEL
ncbi:MAG: oxidoreductase family protein [Steroidobacteraceae bacterium]